MNLSGGGGDGTAGGSAFAFQGLNRLCNYHSIKDLKTFRTVSKAWNDAVTFHPRYRTAKVTLGAGWFREANALQLGHLTSWAYVTLYQFHYSKNSKFFSQVWKICGANVTNLTLRKVKVSCTELNAFLNVCPSLRNLTFSNMDFSAETAGLKLELRHQLGQQPLENRHAIYCSHVERYEHPGPEPLLPPTITHLRFDATSYFPFCTLDYLAERCRGKLEKFEMENTPVLSRPPNQIILRPSLFDVRGRLIRLIRESAQSLTSFTFFNNVAGIEFLTDVSDVPNLALTELILGVYFNGRANDHGHRLAAPAAPQQHVEPFLALIEAQVPAALGLRRLFLKCQYTAAVQNTLNGLRNGNRLEKLKLSFDSNPRELPLDLRFLEHLHVEDLVLMGKLAEGLAEAADWGRSAMFPNSNYWVTLPETLRTFVCAHKMDRNCPIPISQALVSNRNYLLTKLCVRDARFFNDNMVQQIIEHLTQLQDLTLQKACRITDSGLTGISRGLATSLRTCGSHSVLSGADGVTVTRTTRSIKELIYMRKINLTGCTFISDVSCRYGFQFNDLQSIDLTECHHVSDIGLYWLGRNNLRLRELHLRKNPKISHFGINQLVYHLKSLTKIYTSHFLLERQLGSYYVLHPLIHEIARVASDINVRKTKFRREF